MSRKLIDPKDFIGHEYNGIKILDTYHIPYGWWGAVVQCSCGRISKMGLSRAKSLKECPHKFRKYVPKND